MDCKPWTIGLLLAVLVPPASPAGELQLFGLALVGGTQIGSQPGWLEGGFGRTPLGADSSSDVATEATGQLHLALDWRPGRHFAAYVHATARAEPSAAEGSSTGVIEAYVQTSFAVRRTDRLGLQLGHFFLPTSRENVEVLWASPYTITFSALNTWIAEEVRPTGLLGEYTWGLDATDEIALAGCVFQGNDSDGSLLAWRGWTMGDRITTYGEVLPLPPLGSLGPDGPFRRQRDDGTRPFESDLDGRTGWAAYLRWRRPQRAAFQWTRYDNRGDRGLHRGEYAWTTRFDLFGAELHWSDRWTLLAEWVDGETGMGSLERNHVQADFRAGYVLLSWAPAPLRFSLRYDRFEATDRDHTAAENNDDDGDAWTLAMFWEPYPAWRVGLEALHLDAQRPAALESGFDPQTDVRSITLELRYYFDH